MPRLASFYAENRNVEDSGSTLSIDPSAQYQPFFDGMVAFPSLEKVNITGLLFTSVIWGMDCCNDIVSSFCKLNHLTVYGCDKLEIVIPLAMLHRLHNLEYIEVYQCTSLRTMFSLSVARDLTHLKEMGVGYCGMMGVIIEAGEQIITDGLLFPELTTLKLLKLPSLTGFWCYQSGKANTCKVTYSLRRLSSVVLTYLPNLKSFFHGVNFEFHTPALEEVQVCNCGLSTLFTFSMFRTFQLKNLLVADCELLEKIVEDLRGDKNFHKIITLFKLKSVRFGNLPNLKSFFHDANYEFYMPVLTVVSVQTCGFSDTLFKRSAFRNLKQLEKLEVSDCGLLEDIFEDVRGDETSDLSEKIITLSQLSWLLLEDLPNLKSFVYSENYECNMPALTKVKVVNCGLSTLFTCSVFQELQQLKELVVINCRLLEHIVGNVRGDETCDTNGKIITIHRLSLIKLQNLPNLKSFSCTTSYVFNMPKFCTFWLRECPRIQYFTNLKIRAPFVEVYSEQHAGERYSDLNDYITQIYRRGSYSTDNVGESSCSNQELGTGSVRVEEEKPQEIETDQP